MAAFSLDNLNSPPLINPDPSFQSLILARLSLPSFFHPLCPSSILVLFPHSYYHPLRHCPCLLTSSPSSLSVSPPLHCHPCLLLLVIFQLLYGSGLVLFTGVKVSLSYSLLKGLSGFQGIYMLFIISGICLVFNLFLYCLLVGF